MGSCLCKKKDLDLEGDPFGANMYSESAAKKPRIMEDETMELILEMLQYIGSFQEGGDDSPPPLVKLNSIADSEEGWAKVVQALIATVPLNNPLGPSVITIVFDDCPLPTKETVVEFTRNLRLNVARAYAVFRDMETIRQERNTLVVLGCIAEKFGGPTAIEVLTQDMIHYLCTLLLSDGDSHLVLHALIALEKFSRTTENKDQINKCFTEQIIHPLMALDLHYDSEDFIWRQVGFCARWAMDNSFAFPGRVFTYETQDMSEITAMLDTKDVSEYLKISADGLEARCDSHSFESVRGTFKMDRGCWYYEAEIVTAGVMQIGWATKKSSFQNHDGYGVGDDSFSLAYDGCRRLIWHKAQPTPDLTATSWGPGDILGCLIDVDRQEAIFALNTHRLPVCTDIFNNSSKGFYAAASFMAHQQCRFNFGAKPFRFPPQDRKFKVMNQYGKLSDDDKKVIPRRILLEKIRLEDKVIGQPCAVCLNATAAYGLEPCEHTGFCLGCVQKLQTCPFCREAVVNFFYMAL